MSEAQSSVERDIRSSFRLIAQAAEVIELLMAGRFVNVPASLMSQALSLRNLGLVFVSDEDPTVFRAHTKLRSFVDHVQGTVSGLHALDEDHAALLNQCVKLHSKFIRAKESGEDGLAELDDFESWAYALGDSIDLSLSRFDAYLGSNFSMARTLRQRVELNKEAVAQAGALSSWLAAVGKSELRQRLSEEIVCEPLLLAFNKALFNRGKLAQRLRRCSRCIERLREKLNSTQMASRRHALLAKMASLDESGFVPFAQAPAEIDEKTLARLVELSGSPASQTPATFSPGQPGHAKLFEKTATKAARWARELEPSLAPLKSNEQPAGSLEAKSVIQKPKAIQKAFDDFLDDLFAKGERSSVCDWLEARHKSELTLEVSLTGMLAWCCAQSQSFYERRDVAISLVRQPSKGWLQPARVLDASFDPFISEEAL